MAALKPGDEVMVHGRGGPVEFIVVSMLRELGYVPRPLCSKAAMGLYEEKGVKGHVFGGSEPMPAVTGLVFADEDLQPEVAGALVRKLAQSGPLSRVAMLSNHRYAGGFNGLFSGGTERDELEAATRKVCEDAGAEWTVVRTGTLRGGGPKTYSAHCLPESFYSSFGDTALGPTAGIDEEYYDLTSRGIQVGDIAGGFLGNIGVPQTNRIAVGMALAGSLALDEAAGNIFGITSTESKESFNMDFDWAAAIESK